MRGKYPAPVLVQIQKSGALKLLRVPPLKANPAVWVWGGDCAQTAVQHSPERLASLIPPTTPVRLFKGLYF